MEIAHFLFGIFGGKLITPFISFLHRVIIFFQITRLHVFVSYRITFRRIVRSKSTEQFSGVPYVMTLLNCLLSAWYGLPFVSPHNILVSTINFTGATIESIYVVMFIIYAPRRVKVRMGMLLTLVLAVFSLVALVSVFALDGQTRKLFCGFAATIFSIVMYAAPLSIMVKVITKLRTQTLVVRTKSVEFMPFFLSLFVFLCGTSWFVYGLLGHDPFVYVPNGFGCLLGTLQLILYAIYRNHNKPSGPSKATTFNSIAADDANKLEMGLGETRQVNTATTPPYSQQNGHV
ncbi:hypothetical protein IFM89_039062 [Coptis chinensis]|uniref:Bidirectional sugar transporter SWEET n=1 Tax=Coptis chinensis TaxID=261450 RepID=A0A835I857_9MAGN|nr:hypothetical protein IFM89_039062 [Coptis chinensis]